MSTELSVRGLRRMRVPALAFAYVFGLGGTLAGCVGVGIGIPIVPGVSLGVGYGAGGPSIGLGTGFGPVGAGVGINGSGQVIGSAGLGVSAGPVGVGVGKGVVLADPAVPSLAPAVATTAAGVPVEQGSVVGADPAQGAGANRAPLPGGRPGDTVAP